MFGNKARHILHTLQVHFSSLQDFIAALKSSSFSHYLIFVAREFQRRQALKWTELMPYVTV